MSNPKPVWSKANRKIITAYVSDIAARLGLRDWDIRIDFDTSAGECCAAIKPWSNQRRATLLLGDEFATFSLADQRDTIVHELVHCHLYALHEVVETAHKAVLEPQAAKYADAVVNCAIESATDALAGALAASMPLLILRTETTMVIAVTAFERPTVPTARTARTTRTGRAGAGA